MKGKELKNVFRIIEKIDTESKDGNIIFYEISITSGNELFSYKSGVTSMPDRKFRCNYKMKDGAYKWISSHKMRDNVPFSELTDKFTQIQIDQIDQNIEESQSK